MSSPTFEKRLLTICACSLLVVCVTVGGYFALLPLLHDLAVYVAGPRSALLISAGFLAVASLTGIAIGSKATSVKPAFRSVILLLIIHLLSAVWFVAVAGPLLLKLV
jgi:hypothetical protein